MKFINSKTNYLLSVILSFRREFFAVGVCGLIVNLLMIAPSIYMLQIFDRVMINRNEMSLIFLTGIILFLYIMMYFAEKIRSQYLIFISAAVDKKLNAEIFKVSFDAHTKNSEKIPSEIFNDFTNIKQFLTGPGILIFFDLLWVPLFIWAISLIHHSLAYLAVIFSVIQLLLSYIGYIRTHSLRKKLEEEEKKNRQLLNAKLRNFEAVTAMGMLENLKNIWLKKYFRLQENWNLMGSKNASQQAYIKFSRYLMQSLTLAAGAYLVIDNQMSPASIIAANFLVSRALYPIDQLVSSLNAFFSAKLSYGRLNQLLINASDVSQVTQLKGNEFHVNESVELKHLFALSSADGDAILSDLNLTFKAGQMIAIRGSTGSGKSTLAKCLVGVWPFIEGDILFDNRSSQQFNAEAIGSQIGYMPQDVELLDGTIAENISRFYKLNPEKVIEAAKLAGIHEMILKFKNGYDTLVGSGGAYLSGGQKQRLGLARAVYGEPSFIVLDEPNSHLDDLGERALFMAIQQLKQMKKTVFFITHRQGILPIADSTLVLKNGHVVSHHLNEQVNEQKKLN